MIFTNKHDGQSGGGVRGNEREKACVKSGGNSFKIHRMFLPNFSQSDRGGEK